MHERKRRPEMWFLSYIETNFAPQTKPEPSLDCHHTVVRSYS